MRGETVAAPTIHAAIRLAVEVAELQGRDVEPNSFKYIGLTGNGHELWFATYPKESE